MADAEDTIATVRNISIIIAAAVVIISTLVMVAVLGAQRERQLRKAVAEQAERMAVLKVRSTLHDGSKQAPAMRVRDVQQGVHQSTNGDEGMPSRLHACNCAGGNDGHDQQTCIPDAGGLDEALQEAPAAVCI